jgi:hypothetical protein
VVVGKFVKYPGGPTRNRKTGTEILCIYKFLTASLLKRLRNGRFTSERTWIGKGALRYRTIANKAVGFGKYRKWLQPFTVPAIQYFYSTRFREFPTIYYYGLYCDTLNIIYLCTV